MVHYIWLSHPLGLKDPRPPAIPPPRLSEFLTVAKDGASVHVLRVASHTGTHVDAPRHVVEDGLAITDFAPEEFVFTHPVVIDLPLWDCEIVMPEHLAPHAERLGKADLALFRFNYARVRVMEPKRFSERSPGFGVESARWLRGACPGLRAVGMDVPSLACIAHLDRTMAAHNELLGGERRRFLVIEDMDLGRDLWGMNEVRLSPWLVKGMDSAPCSVVGLWR